MNRGAGGPIRTLLLSLSACLFAPALANAAGESAGDARLTMSPPAPLVIENRTVFVFRATALGHPPAERAADAEQRIDRILRKGGPGKVKAEKAPQGTILNLDGVSVFAVTPADVDEAADETLDSTADTATTRLELAVRETQERKSPVRMLAAAGIAAAATLLYAALLYGVVAARRRLIARLSSALSAKAEKLKVGGVIALHPSQILSLVRGLVIIAAWVIGLFATYLWLTFTLELFPYTRPWGEELRDYLIGLLGSMLRAAVHAVPGLLTIAIIFTLTRLVAGVVNAFFDRVQMQRIEIGWLDADTAKPTQRLVVFVLWLFATAMAYPYLPGADTDAFKGLSVLVGLMVSIGASGLVGQAASGMILMYARTLRPGEYVKIGEAEGTVIELGMFAVRLQTGAGEETVLPNAFVIGNLTRNYSRETPGNEFVVQVKTTIGYSTPWRQVHAMLLDAARRTQGVLSEPKPYVVQTALSDFYVEYSLVAFAGPEAPVMRAMTISALHGNVMDVFNEHGVQIMSPHYLGDPKEPQIVPKERWFPPPARKPGA
jgi:small-conductance mechanosensitive channel